MQILYYLKQKRSSKKLLSFWLVLLLISFYRLTDASNCDSNKQTIWVEADTFLFNNGTKIGIYRGHVRLKQGSRVLNAECAISYSNQSGQIIKIIATGHPAYYRAIVFPNRPELIATGNTIYYYPLKDCLEAVGNAQIIQDQHQFKGQQINYDFKKKTVGSPPSKKGHTQISLAPLQSAHL
jgi:lipopolysaccharide export system protein LptA